MDDPVVRHGAPAYAVIGERYGAHDPPPPWRLWRILRRNRLLIASCTATLVATTAYFTGRLTPVYEASASIRIEEEASRLEDFGTPRVPPPNQLQTEIEILQSRALAEAVAESLGLQVALRTPPKVSRQHVLSHVRVSPDVSPGYYRLELRPEGHFSLLHRSAGARRWRVVPGVPTRAGGLELRLAPAATRYPFIEFTVSSLEDAVETLRDALAINRRKRDANIIDVIYQGTDPHLVRDIPNVLATRFIVRRQSERHAEAHSAARFLRQQIEARSAQLTDAENRLRAFREQQGAVSLPDEARTRVTRAAELEAQRNSIEAERVALAELIRAIQDSSSVDPTGAPLAFRNLVAFPTLLQDDAMAGLVASLSAVEDRRSDLLTRRSLRDPDVDNLTARANHLGEQLRAMALTYLRGLTNQVAALDATVAQARQQLDRIPERELRFARLQREARGLEDIVTQLQSRLKEAEIAEAVEDSRVRLVDAAVLPKGPTSPTPLLNLTLALVLGIVLGTSGALLREYVDKTVRSRQHVLVATGLPVLGLLPRAGRRRRWGAGVRIGSPRAGREGAVGSGRLGGTAWTIWGPSLVTVPATPTLLIGGALVGGGNDFSPTLEGYNRLETNLAFARSSGPAQMLMVTSPLPGEGKTTVAVNLAITLAQRGGRVLLIDADLRRGVLAALLRLAPEPGLSDILLGVAPFLEARHSIDVRGRERLHVVGCGRPLENPPPLLVARAPTLLRSLREEYDSIILDTPPVNLVADAAVLGPHSDGVLVVARAGATAIQALAFATDQLRHVRAPVLGAVLNAVDFRHDAGYDEVDEVYRYYARADAG